VPIVTCKRCAETREGLPGPPLPGDLGREIEMRICGACWAEWERTEVMVINELRLNFMDPEAQVILERHLREFLALDGPGAS
jgi:Fe-S cluster biosynthesis and repair protein YggX